MIHLKPFQRVVEIIVEIRIWIKRVKQIVLWNSAKMDDLLQLCFGFTLWRNEVKV